jgi:uncharacterized protein
MRWVVKQVAWLKNKQLLQNIIQYVLFLCKLSYNMVLRPIFLELLEHLRKPQITVITGMRRVGKSTALRYLLDKVEHDNKVYLDLERAEIRFILNQTNYRDIEINLAIEGVDLSKPAVIALDEIQLVQQIPSVIKYLYDTYGTKFLVTGSSSFYLKNHFSESLAGRKRIFEMYPLDFAEFLTFKGIDPGPLRQFATTPFQPLYYLKWREEYEEFLRWGGFPEVVLAETEDDKSQYVKDLINAYIELDIRLLSDFSASDNLLSLIRMLAGRVGSRLDITKLSALLGINRNKVKDYLSLLEYTYFTLPVGAYSKNIDRAIVKQPKLYIADTGILQELAQVSSGQIFENAIALQLARLGQVQYFQKISGAEIDFIWKEKIAIEVKETPSQPDLSKLKSRAASIGLTDCLLVGRNQPRTAFKDFYWGGSFV